MGGQAKIWGAMAHPGPPLESPLIFTAHTALHGEQSWIELLSSSSVYTSKEKENWSYIVGSVKCKENIIVHVTPLLINHTYVILYNNFHFLLLARYNSHHS